MKKILLITWWLGYIGSHAVVAFEQAGYQTLIIDNLINTSQDVLVWIEKILGYAPMFFEWNIWDAVILEKIFSQYNIDGVVHFAGLKAVGESTQKIGLYHKNNISESISLLKPWSDMKYENVYFQAQLPSMIPQMLLSISSDKVSEPQIPMEPQNS